MRDSFFDLDLALELNIPFIFDIRLQLNLSNSTQMIELKTMKQQFFHITKIFHLKLNIFCKDYASIVALINQNKNTLSLSSAAFINVLTHCQFKELNLFKMFYLYVEQNFRFCITQLRLIKEKNYSSVISIVPIAYIITTCEFPAPGRVNYKNSNQCSHNRGEFFFNFVYFYLFRVVIISPNTHNQHFSLLKAKFRIHESRTHNSIA